MNASGPPPIVVMVPIPPELAAVPDEFWRRLVEFIAHSKTGRIVWHFNAGRPEVLELNEHVRARKTVDSRVKSA